MLKGMGSLKEKSPEIKGPKKSFAAMFLKKRGKG